MQISISLLIVYTCSERSRKKAIRQERMEKDDAWISMADAEPFVTLSTDDLLKVAHQIKADLPYSAMVRTVIISLVPGPYIYVLNNEVTCNRSTFHNL